MGGFSEHGEARTFHPAPKAEDKDVPRPHRSKPGGEGGITPGVLPFAPRAGRALRVQIGNPADLLNP